jgi:hypothetical protein
MTALRVEPIQSPEKRRGEYSLLDDKGREIAVVTGKAWANKLAAVDDLLRAVKGLLPRYWRRGHMDHMPGVKAARLAIAKAGKRT